MGDYVERIKNKHLVLNDRIDIENCLDRNLKLKEIAAYIHCDARTVAKEIYRNRELVETKETNKCSLKIICHKHLLCGNTSCVNDCKRCKAHNCNGVCPNYKKEPTCKRVMRFPFSCNGCPKRVTCHFCKYVYIAKEAQEKYEIKLVSSRKHIRYSDEEIKIINNIVSPLIRSGYSPEVILFEHKDELPDISIATLYKLINEQYLSIRNIDLKRKVRRTYFVNRNKVRVNADPKIKEGRYYEDFLEYIGSNPTLNVWELDTVEGKKGGKALMTLLERKSNFMLIFLIDSICQEEIIRNFNSIKKQLGYDLYSKTFPIILTDNGKEFLDPLSIEFDLEVGAKVSYLFYCKARHSEQKGKIEKNHEHVREILPKGTDFNFLSDEAVNLVSNNVNNYPRPQFQSSPLAIASTYLNKKVLKLNNLSSLEKVLLKPELLKDYRKK